jgi:hypothetical protein
VPAVARPRERRGAWLVESPGPPFGRLRASRGRDDFVAVNGQYDSPPFGLQGAYASTGADGSQGMSGQADSMNPATSDVFGQGPIASPGDHGTALSEQMVTFDGTRIDATGAGMGHPQMSHPNAGA